MKYAFILAEKASFTVEQLCRCLNVSSAGYYSWLARSESKRSRDDRRLSVFIGEAHAISRKTYGRPRLYAELKAQGISIGQKRVARLMRAQGLRGRARLKYRSTTNSDHAQPVAPNTLDRNFEPSAANMVWASDTTELRTAGGKRIYLAVTLDLFSRFVVGWHLSAANDTNLVLNALENAIARRSPPPGLLHHSDRGCTYASAEFQRVLRAHEFECSMSRRGNCWDNAVVESFFSTLKLELSDFFESAESARAELFDFIEVFYNQKRRHSAIGYQSPGEHERVDIPAYQHA